LRKPVPMERPNGRRRVTRLLVFADATLRLEFISRVDLSTTPRNAHVAQSGGIYPRSAFALTSLGSSARAPAELTIVEVRQAVLSQEDLYALNFPLLLACEWWSDLGRDTQAS